jgi:hypothetical protein
MDTTTAYVLREVDDLDDDYLEAELAAELPVAVHSSHPGGC